ncbi:hypothetical protein NECID01_0680 [Nematocida sp. AWRm77]|nr:hypothetical protein NECID01_0680 [Nematocida sp. AWRm77]
MKKYLEEIEQWKTLAEWKAETILHTLRMNSLSAEWSALVRAGEKRALCERHKDAYTEEMYALLKSRARSLGMPTLEIENTQKKEESLRGRAKAHTARLADLHKKEVFWAQAQMLKGKYPVTHRGAELDNYLAEHVLLSMLPPSVRMYIVEGEKGEEREESVLFIWLDRKDPFNNVDVEFMRGAHRVVIIEEAASAGEELKQALRALFSAVDTATKENGPTEDRTRVTGFKVPGDTPTP